MSQPITEITHHGQPFIDEPIVAQPKRVDPVDFAVAAMFGRPLAQPLLLGYERVQLRWIKPEPR